MTKASVEFMTEFNPDSLAEEISNMWVSWDNGRNQWLERVQEVTQYIYATSTKDTTNVKNPWSHSTHIPKLTQIYDTLGANYSASMFNRPDFFEFYGSDFESNTLRRKHAIKHYLMHKHNYNNFFQEMQKCLDDWVRAGNCFLRLEYVRQTVTDPGTELPIVTYEGPMPIRVSPNDIVFDYTAKNFQDSPKIIRAIMTRGEFLRKTKDNPDYDQAAIERAMEMYSRLAAYDGDHRRDELNRDAGFSDLLDAYRGGRVEVLDFVGDIYDPHGNVLHKDRLMTVLDRRFIIRDDQIDDYQGFMKIYHCGWRKRPDNLWAMGPLDNIVGMQYLINHLENARADGFDQMLAPDRVFKGQVEVEHDGPVTNYYIDDGEGDVKNLTPDGTVLRAETQIQMKELQMEASAGAPRQTMGFRTPGEKTAFEVQQLISAAQRIFQNKLEAFEKEFVNEILEGELELSVKNLNTYDTIKTLDTEIGLEAFMKISKEDLTARGRLKALGSSHFERRARLSQELQVFEQVLASDPGLAVHFPAQKRAKLWNEVLDLWEYDLYVPFGAIEEQLELQQATQAAQQVSDELAVAQDMMNEADVPAQGGFGVE